MRHLILTEFEVEQIERLIEKEKDEIAHLMATAVMGKTDDKNARLHFLSMHSLQNSLEDHS